MKNSTTTPNLLSLYNSFVNTPFTANKADPSGFKIRLKSIYLVQDQTGASDATNNLGNNVGDAIFIWTASDCSKGSSDETCKNMSWFNLKDDTATVNKNLASQKVTVTAGTYNYIKLGLLGEQQGPNNSYINTSWEHPYLNADLTDGAKQFASIQTEWAAKFKTPLTVAADDSITITLDYTLNDIIDTSGSIQEKDAQGGTDQGNKADDCTNTSGNTYCIYFPKLTVSAEKAASTTSTSSTTN